MARLETKLSATITNLRPAPRSPTLRSSSPASPRTRHMSVSSNSPDAQPSPIVVVSDRLAKLQAQYATLEAKNKELTDVLDEQEGLIEMLKEDLKQAKLRRVDPQKSSSAHSNGLASGTRSRPSPLISAVDMASLSSAAEDGFRLTR